MTEVQGILGQSNISPTLCTGISWESDTDSVDLGQSLRFCLSNKLPDDADGAGLWTTVCLGRDQRIQKILGHVLGAMEDSKKCKAQ